MSALAYFQQVTQYPRPSGKEEKIRTFLIQWAEKRGFQYRVDAIGNCIIFVPAKNTNSKEVVILQSHMDMVCVKTPESVHDFEKDPIEVIEKDGYLHANNTTLGADNGIGIALSMAATDFESHPALELVFTMDEEVGMTGVQNLDFSLLSGKTVLNLDSEEENMVYISSAGGARYRAKKEIIRASSKNFWMYTCTIFGMKGGHSGCEIHENRGNAVVALCDFLSKVQTETELYEISGGVAFNVIPSKAEAIVGIADKKAFITEIESYLASMKKYFHCEDIVYSLEEIDLNIFPIKNAKEILATIASIKSGVYAMSEKIENLVETSMNLGVLESKNEVISCDYLARSSVNSEVLRLFEDTKKVYEAAGFEVQMSDIYYGWQDDPDSRLVQIAKAEIEKVLGYAPKIWAIHAGLESGQMVSGLWKWSHAISIGPNMYAVHSVQERVEIASVIRMEEALKGILSKL